MTQPVQLIVGHVYRGKRPRNSAGLVNDRQITWIGWDQVQYDSPSVANGRHYPRMSKEKFLAWAAEDVTAQMPKGEWATWPILRVGKENNPTKAQMLTLRRLNTGIEYAARGDGKKGTERRRYRDKIDDINANSIPPLLRLGLIAFSNPTPETLWGRVELTEAGRAVLAGEGVPDGK